VADLVVFGAGDIARISAYYFASDSPHRIVGFTVDDGFKDSEQFEGLPLVPSSEVVDVFPPESCKAFVALSYAGMNRLRAEKYEWMLSKGYECVSYVSSRCTWLTDHPVGANCLVLEDNTVQPFARIGNNVTLWSGNHIGHDSIIEDHCFISSHVVVSGWVRVRSYCFLGVNSTLGNNIEIGARGLIGAGAVIVKDTEEGGVYVPEKARLLSKRSDELDL
jgi:sugar O-acyltransferase (sialic acid O-acetyltransferase NeuD family)